MSLDNYIEAATALSNIEAEIIATKRHGMNTTSEQNEELLQAMDTSLSCIAEAMNNGYSIYDLAVAAKDLLGVDVDDFFTPDDEV